MSGTRIREPAEGPGVVEVDSVDVAVDGENRRRQRVEVATTVEDPLNVLIVRTGEPMPARIVDDEGTPFSPSNPLDVAGTVVVANPGPDPKQDGLTNAELRAESVDVRIMYDGDTVVDAANPLPTRSFLTDAAGAPYTPASPLPVDIGGSVTIDQLNVEFESHVSTVNSRVTPLVANEVFVGQWETCVNYAAISATILTDADSAPFGAMIQFSPDGVNVVHYAVAHIPANTPTHFVVDPKGAFFRIVYTNGPVAQTMLAAEVTLRHNAPTTYQLPVDAPVYGDGIAQLTQSVLMGKLDTGAPFNPAIGAYEPLAITADGRLKVDVSDKSSGPAQLTATQATANPTTPVPDATFEHINPGNHSSFSLDVRGSGTWIIERQVGPGLEWTAVGAFLAGSTQQQAQWSTPGAFHGNISSAHALRVRAIDLPSGPLTVFIRSGPGVGTVTIGIGRMQVLGTSQSAILVTTVNAASASPQRIDTGPSQRRSVLIRSRTSNPNGSRVYIGMAATGLSTSVGTVEMNPGDVMTLPLTEGRALYAFATGGAGTIEVIEVSQ